MSGGLAFVLDESRTLQDKLNTEMVEAIRIDTEATETYRFYLKALIKEFVEKTGSAWGQEVLSNFSKYLPDFWLIKSRAISVDDLYHLFVENTAA